MFRAVLHSPYGLQELIVRDWPAGIQHQIVQDAEFLGGEMYLPPAFQNQMPRRIEFDFSATDYRVRLACFGAERGYFHLPGQFRGGDKFDGSGSLHLTFRYLPLMTLHSDGRESSEHIGDQGT